MTRSTKYYSIGLVQFWRADFIHASQTSQVAGQNFCTFCRQQLFFRSLQDLSSLLSHMTPIESSQHLLHTTGQSFDILRYRHPSTIRDMRSNYITRKDQN